LAYIAFFLLVGLLLIVVPWSAFWEVNYFVERWSALRPALNSHVLRGAISCLGIVNVVAGVTELSILLVPDPPSEAEDHRRSAS
jgi:hypothetical protein